MAKKHNNKSLPPKDSKPPNLQTDEAINLLRNLKPIFPTDAERILRLSLNDVDPLPFGYYHIDFWLEICPPLNERLKEDARVFYVLLCAYYFLQDAYVDEHLDSKFDVLYLAHLLSGAWYFFDKTCRELTPDKKEEISKKLLTYISKNAKAVKDEYLFQKELLMPSEEEYESIVGRSNPFVFIYELFSALADKPVEPHVMKLCSDDVFLLQLADDLGDWREDYQAGRYTSVIRTCFAKKGRFLTEKEIEEEMFFGGVYEQQAAKIISGLDKLISQLETDSYQPYNKFKDFVESQRERVYQVLVEWISVKIQTLNDLRKQNIA